MIRFRKYILILFWYSVDINNLLLIEVTSYVDFGYASVGHGLQNYELLVEALSTASNFIVNLFIFFDYLHANTRSYIH